MKCYSTNIYYLRMQVVIFFALVLGTISFDPSEDIINNNYYGEWMSPNQPFNYFDQTSGNIQILFQNSLISFTTPHVDMAEVTMLDPIYHSSKNIKFKISLGKYDSILQLWNGTQQIKFQLIKQGMKEMEVSCYVAFQMQMLFTNLKSQDEYRFIMNIDSLLDSSNSCKISLQATTKPYKNQEKVFYYCLFVAALSGISLAGLLVFHKRFGEDVRVIRKISIKCVMLTLIQLWFLTVAHIWMLILQHNNYGFFLIPIVLISIQAASTLKLLILIFKVKYQNSLTSKKWVLFIITLTILFFGYGVLMYIYPYDMLTVLLQSFIGILQIVKNSKHQKPVKISGHFFCGVFLLQYVLGLYYRGCPSNIYSIQPSSSFIFFWNGIYIIQAIILLIQRSIGGRFFIPQCIYRHKNSYSLMKQLKTEDQCGICIGTFSINQQFALTKCGHSYHQMCLKEWLKVNEKCPMCRTQIQEL